MLPSKPICTLIIILHALYLVKSLKTVGESCDGDCDERLGLFCGLESKICECMLPNSTIYDTSRSKCVTKAGHPCRRFGTENLCVAHASCEGLSLPCECDRNYFQTRNGTCIPTAKYGESCSSKKPCDKAAGIECVGSKNKQFQCQCKYPRDQYYDSEDKKCISYAGGNCSFELSCVKNAVCSQDIFELRKGETLRKSFYYNATVGKKCACLPGFKITKNRDCLATYRRACDDYKNNICNPEENLKCFDNKICICKNPLHQIYNLESHKCQNLIGSSCEGSGQADCVSNAECRRGSCTCNSGFNVTPSRSCLKDFGENCSTDECNFSRGLSCQNNTCSCFDGFLVYDQVKRECFSLEGSPCGSFSLTSGDEPDALDFYFQTQETCVKHSNPTKTAVINCREDLKCESVMGYKQCVK